MNTRLLTGLMALILTAFAAFAPAQGFQARTISVNGHAEVHVDPDEAEIGLGIEITEKELATAKQVADERMKAILEALKANGVEAKDIRTDRINVNPIYHYGERERVFQGYQITQNLAVTVRNVQSFETILSAALESGANFVHGINFKSSKKQEHLDRARAMALDAARKKARAMANQLGQEIGRPLAIVEGSTQFPGPIPYGFGGARMMANAEMAQASAADASGTIAAGQITLSADVSVTFELVDSYRDGEQQAASTPSAEQ